MDNNTSITLKTEEDPRSKNHILVRRSPFTYNGDWYEQDHKKIRFKFNPFLLVIGFLATFSVLALNSFVTSFGGNIDFTQTALNDSQIADLAAGLFNAIVVFGNLIFNKELFAHPFFLGNRIQRAQRKLMKKVAKDVRKDKKEKMFWESLKQYDKTFVRGN